jgi:hypothetical protein
MSLRLPYVVSIDFWQYKVEVEQTKEAVRKKTNDDSLLQNINFYRIF